MASLRSLMKKLCSNEEQVSSSGKGIHIVLGYFFILNYCLGTGFLGVPYSFYYSGYLAGIPTLIGTAFLTWLTSIWLLEVMARAQALEYSKAKNNSNNNSEESEDSGIKEEDSSTQRIDSDSEIPVFEVTLKRKFEMVELSEIFVGKWFKYLYLFIIVIYGFLGCWSFTSVAGSAWSTNIPFNFGGLKMCASDAFHNRVLPSDGCLHAYYFSVFIFGIIVITLSVLDLQEQIVVQVVMGLSRYVTILAILLYSIVKLIQGGDSCEQYHDIISPNTTIENITSLDKEPLEDIVFKFGVKGWLLSIPVFVYAFMLHSGVSSLTHPIRQKKYLHWMLTINFSSAMLGLMALGIIAPLWFQASIQENITLNWVALARAGNSPQLRVLSYYIILFPSLDVISAYPLTVHCIVNNIYMVLTGNDTSVHPTWRCDWLLRFTLRFSAALLPLLAAFGVANLIYVLKYAGIVGFGVCFLFPTVLQIRSIFACIKRYDIKKPPQIGMSDVNRSDTSPESVSEGSSNAEKSPLLKEKLKSDKRPLYMTPYSNVVLSNPIFIMIISVFEVCLFVLAFASLFFEPHKKSCMTVLYSQ